MASYRLPALGRNVLQILSRRGASAHAERPERDAKSRVTAVARLRPACPSDIGQICRLLNREWPRIGLNDWHRLFDYSWLNEKPNLGFVLTVNDEVVGFLGTVFAYRRINGKSGMVCNLTSWCVLPEYRGWSIALLMAALRDRSISYTNLTAGPGLVSIFDRIGFQQLNTQRVLMPPLLHAGTLWARGARIVSDPEQVRALLDEEQRRIFNDHAPYECLQLALVDGPEIAYLVAKRRMARDLPVSELFYCSAPDLLMRHLERTKLAILWRQRTLALVADSGLFRSRAPRGMTRKQVVLVHSPVFSAHEIGSLYSERVLLPI